MNNILDSEKLKDEKTRAIYFNELSQGSRTLELLLNTAYNSGITPIIASVGGKKKLSYIVLNIDKDNLNTIGRLIDIVEEIPDSEFNIHSHADQLYAELSCELESSENLFTRIKDIIEESSIELTSTHNLTIMNTIYNISKIIDSITQADILFATNDTLYKQGKCGISIYKESQKDKINTKKSVTIAEVIKKLNQKKTIDLPTIFFCNFEELRNFYFELDETVYSKEDEQNG